MDRRRRAADRSCTEQARVRDGLAFHLAQGVPPEYLQAYAGTAVLLGVDEDGETHTIPEAAARLLNEAGMPGMTGSAVTELKEAIAKL